MKFKPNTNFTNVYAGLEWCMSDGLHAYRIKKPVFQLFQQWMRDAKSFDFGFGEWSIDGSDALTQFTYDCITQGLYTPPFDVVFMSWPDAPLGNNVLSDQKAAALMVTLMRRGESTSYGRELSHSLGDGGVFIKGQSDNDIDVNLVFSHMLESGGKSKKETLCILIGFASVPSQRMAMLQDVSFLRSYKSESKMSTTPGYIFPRSHVIAANVYSDAFCRERYLAGAPVKSGQDAAVTMRSTAYFLGLMCAKSNLLTYEHQVATHVAERRLRERKTPWTSYTTIVLPKEHGIGGLTSLGDRKSPRLHSRRGHIRQIGDRVVAVRPCLVGSSEYGRVISNYISENL